MDTPTVDPHHPSRIAEMAGASDWRRLETLLQKPDAPHIILSGPAGVGKSCAVRLALRTPTASAKSSISLWHRCTTQDPTLRSESRDRIKNVARRTVEPGHIRWLVLEHADLLHADAQAFLRRIMETTCGTRFLLEVRDASAIAEPLLSRAVIFQAPVLMEHEIRSEVLRRKSVGLGVAGTIAAQSGGNIRWAVLQGLDWTGGACSVGFIDPTVPSPSPSPSPSSVYDWSTLLATLEALQRTGTNPRAWLASGVGDDRTVWERPGGACPWAIVAETLSRNIV